MGKTESTALQTALLTVVWFGTLEDFTF